jgi:hypothetical protein
MDSSNPPSGPSSSETNHQKMKLHNLHRHLERLYRARPVNEEDSDSSRDNNNNERFIEDGDISQEKVQLPCLPCDDEEEMKDTSVNNPVLPFHPSLPLLFGVTSENDESERPIRM